MDAGLKARRALLLYLGAVVAATLIHDWRLLAAGLTLALALAGGQRWRLLRRALLAVVAFNLTVSAGYTAIALWQGAFSAQYLLLVNSRVLLMVFLGFWFVSRVDIVAAVSFSPTLSFLATLAVGQARTLARQVRDFQLAFVSRNPRRPRPGDRLLHAGAQAQHLLDRSIHAADEAALAMRSRGCFDD
jgi:cobalt/nickel transport system permease protein